MRNTTASVEVACTRPVTFRLPPPGETDRFFGCSRSWYYQAEKRGWLNLIRVRDAGRERGITWVVFDEVLALLRSRMESQGAGIEGTVRSHAEQNRESEQDSTQSQNDARKANQTEMNKPKHH